MDADALLVGLDDAQREAVTTPALPLCVLAGAGSGKTRVLTRRIAWRCATGVDDPRRVLALTFTRAAAVELTTRLRTLGLRDAVRAGTFHAVAWAELRARAAEAGRPTPALLERPGRLLHQVDGSLDRAAVAEVAGELGWLRARCIQLDDYPRTNRPTSVPAARIVELGHAYAAAKRKRGVVDFDDLLELLARHLQDDSGFAAAQRWRFAHLYVDELQDLNPLQHRLLEEWRGGRPDLTGVGDPNQAVYGWNGSDPAFIERFAEHFPGGSMVAIDRSYRSTTPILDVANAVLDAGSLGGVRLVSVRGEGPVPETLGYADDDAEVKALARAVLDAKVPGSAWGHQAVLARTNRQLDTAEAAMRAVGIPTRQRGRLPFTEEPVVRAVLRELTAPGAAFAEVIAALPQPAPEDLADDAGVDAGASEQEAAVLGRLAELADRYSSLHRPAEGHGFRAWLLHEADDLPGGDAVDLVTFHGAKGREWPLVHVIGVEEGYVPIARAATEAALAEERRLFYVACTRAERRLRLSWAQARAFGDGEPMARRPSPFLTELGPTLERLRRTEAPAPPVAVPRPRPPVVADDRVATLRRWRDTRARAAGVAPASFLPDAVLARIVETDPADAAALAAVPGTRPLVLAGLADEILDRLRG